MTVPTRGSADAFERQGQGLLLLLLLLLLLGEKEVATWEAGINAGRQGKRVTLGYEGGLEAFIIRASPPDGPKKIWNKAEKDKTVFDTF